MKALGIVRNIDSLGRIVIPMEVRKTQGWNQDTPMEMFMDGDSLVISSYTKERERENVINQLSYVKSFTESESTQQVLQNAIEFLDKKKA